MKLTFALFTAVLVLASNPLLAAPIRGPADLSWAAAEDARKAIEAELGKFDGTSPPTKNLRDAVASLKAHLDILRVRAGEHHFAPPNMGRIAVLCEKIEKDATYSPQAARTAIGSLEREVKDLEEAQRRWVNKLSAARAVDAMRIASEGLLAWVPQGNVNTALTAVQYADAVFDFYSPAAKKSRDPFYNKHREAITRIAEQDFLKTRGYPFDPNNPRNQNDHVGFITTLQKVTPLYAGQRKTSTERDIARLRDQLDDYLDGKMVYDANWADVGAICDDLDKTPRWTPTPQPVKTPPQPNPPPRPIPPKPVPVKTPNCREVPYIIDLAQSAAEALIAKAGFAGAKAVAVGSSYYVEKDAVVSQYPHGGDCVDAATIVEIEVSGGKPEMTGLVVEPAEAQIDYGETAEFSARIDYSDGSHNYLTYAATWTPGPDHKFTGQRAGTYTVIAALDGLYGKATVTVGERKIPRVSIPEGVRGQEATPADYVWNAFCSPRTGEVTYGKDYDATRLRVMGGPFIGPRTAKKWIDENCPSWRCATDGRCATQPAAAAPGTEGWSALCSRRTGEITLGKKSDPTRQVAMAGPFLGEPDARNWVASNCPAWRCTSTGRCDASGGGTAAAPSGGAGRGGGGRCDELRVLQDAAISNADSRYEAGDLSGAMSVLLAAQAQSRTPASRNCRGSERIADAISKIDRIRGVLGGIDATLASCDAARMANFRDQIARLASPHPLIAAKLPQFDEARSRCAVEQAGADCRKKYGSGYRAGNPAGGSGYYCIPDQTAANSKCNELNRGSGWAAYNIRADGSFDCRLTQAGRNADCERLYGKGWYAGTVRGDGSYNCHMGKSARTASCRQQYGRGWYAGALRRDGSFLCHGPRQPTAGGGPSGAEVGAAIAGAVIQGIIASQGGGGSRSNCHRRPDGTIHCGSN